MKIDGFFERLANAKIPNFSFAHFRYKLQDGDYRYVEQCVIAGEENGIPPGMFRIYVIDIHNMMIRRIGVSNGESALTSAGRDQLTGLYASKEFYTKAETIIKDNPKIIYYTVSIVPPKAPLTTPSINVSEGEFYDSDEAAIKKETNVMI